jgi:hypothetical protein
MIYNTASIANSGNYVGNSVRSFAFWHLATFFGCWAMIKAVSFRAARDQLETVSAIFSNNNQIIEAYIKILRRTLGTPRFRHAATVSACFKSRLVQPNNQAASSWNAFLILALVLGEKMSRGWSFLSHGLMSPTITYLRCAFPQDIILRPFRVSRSF